MSAEKKRQARRFGRYISGVKQATSTCPCCRVNRKSFKRLGNARRRTQAKYRVPGVVADLLERGHA